MFLRFRRKAKGDMQLNLEHHYKQSGGDKCPYFLKKKKKKKPMKMCGFVYISVYR